VQARTSLGLSLARTGKTNEALQELGTALNAAPGHLLARLTLAETLWSCGDTNKALGEYAEVARLQPASDFVHFRYGAALARALRMPEAETELTRALTLNPKLLEARLELARVLGTLGKFADAENHLQQSLQQQETAETRFQLGVLEIQRRTTDAVKQYSRALELKPDLAAALNELAWLLATNPDDTLRNGPRAVALAERARDLSGGKDPRLWGTLAAAYAESGQYQAAVKTQTEAIRLAQGGEPNLLQGMRLRLGHYQAGRPWRELASEVVK
jgi:tetratricopeptide (TPR) repeat protein